MTKNNKKDNSLEMLHEVQIEILDEIVRICKKYNLVYYLVGGTLIGAVRHKGFIPWDDDLDIGMPRKDYEKFIKVAKDELKSKYYLHDISTDKKYWQCFLKIRKNNTLFDETMIEDIETHKGIFIDIFPYDNLEKKNIFYKIKWSILRNLFDFSLYYRGIFKKDRINHFIFCKLFSIFRLNTILKFCDKLMQSCKNENSKYLVSYNGCYGKEKETMERNWILPTKKIKFENKMYSCPNDCDAVLTHVYGDYMKLPPKEKRVTHLPKQIIFDEKELKNENIKN